MKEDDKEIFNYLKNNILAEGFTIEEDVIKGSYNSNEIIIRVLENNYYKATYKTNNRYTFFNRVGREYVSENRRKK